MARVTWTREAVAQLELIRAYIGQFDTVAAGRLSGRLIAAGESLGDFPQRGRPTREGCREMPIISPYIIQYEVSGNAVFILRIRHGRQRR